jgi:hypothetical protein
MLALAMLARLALPAPLAAQQARPILAQTADNAALMYWQAFALMPNLDKEQEKLLQDINNVAEWQKLPLHPEAQKLVEASQASLMYLHRGAKIARCDWGLDYNDGVSLMMPHLAKARDLVRLAALRARIEFERGNRKAARADTAAMAALARHVASDPIMISILVGTGLEGVVVDVVAPYVPDLKASHAQAVAMFEALPRAARLDESILLEKDYMARSIIRTLKEEELREPGAGLKLWNNFVLGSSVADSVKDIKDVNEAIRLTEGLLPLYDDLARYVALPNDRFAAEYPAFKEKTKADNAVAGLLLPAIDNIRAKQQRLQARMAMLLAGVAFVEGGAAKLNQIKDPFGSGPFEYKALEPGFELKSKLLYEGQPVTLVIGRRKP